jgi:hypothetical protein
MISRKNFVQNISLGASALLLKPFSILASNKRNIKLIVLDAIAKDDFQNRLPKSFSIVQQHQYITHEKLITQANIDSHLSCLHEIDTNFDTYLHLNSSDNIHSLSFHKLIVDGFDVAHYNYTEYLQNIEKADAIISQLIANEIEHANTNIVIMSSMGRNTYHNHIASENELGGTDHHSDESRECFALEVTNATLLTYSNDASISTKDLFQQFQNKLPII